MMLLLVLIDEKSTAKNIRFAWNVLWNYERHNQCNVLKVRNSGCSSVVNAYKICLREALYIFLRAGKAQLLFVFSPERICISQSLDMQLTEMKKYWLLSVIGYIILKAT